jgi:hypothetical protein
MSPIVIWGRARRSFSLLRRTVAHGSTAMLAIVRGLK